MGDYYISLEEVAIQIAALDSIIEDMNMSGDEAYDLFEESNEEDAKSINKLFDEVITAKQSLRDAIESTRNYLLIVQKTMTEMDDTESKEITSVELDKVASD